MPSLYFSEGTTPLPRDTRWKLLVKWLMAIQANLGVTKLSINDPGIRDTRWILLKKIASAKVGIPWTGPPN